MCPPPPPLGPGRPQNSVGLIGLSMLVIHQISNKIQENIKFVLFVSCLFLETKCSDFLLLMLRFSICKNVKGYS